MEILLKELQIANSVYESEMTTIMSINEIEEMYISESSDGKKENFFKKIIRVFKEFVIKVKDSIKKFFKKKQCSKLVAKFKKQNKEDVKKALRTKKVKGLVNTKILKASHKAVIKDCADLSKKIHNAKSISELEKLEKEISHLGDGYKVAYMGTKNIDRNFFSESEENSGTLTENEINEVINEISNLENCKDIDEVEDITTQANEKLLEIEERYETISDELDDAGDNELTEITRKKQGLLRRIGSKISSVGKKVVNTLTKRNYTLLDMIAIMTVGFSAGSLIGYNIGSDNG